jgi:hypothetical protein
LDSVDVSVLDSLFLNREIENQNFASNGTNLQMNILKQELSGQKQSVLILPVDKLLWQHLQTHTSEHLSFLAISENQEQIYIQFIS